MVRKIDKALKKLTKNEREKIEQVLSLILTGSTKTLDIKKLKGFSDIYRVRSGDMRILYRMDGEEIYLLAIERRGEGTYKNL